MSDASQSRKQRTAEETARQSEEQLRLLLENIQDMVSRHLPDSTIIYVSPSCRSLIGYTAEELVNTRAADYVHPDDVQATLATMDEAIARRDGHYRVQHRTKHKDGGHVWVETAGRLLYGTDGRLREIQCIVRDITERKRAAKDLLAWKNRYESAVKSSGQVLYDWDSATNQVTYGGAIEQVLGYSADGLSGDLSRWVELIHPDDREFFTEKVKHLLATRESIRFEFRVRRKDGAYVLMEEAGPFIEESHGEVTRVIGFIKDITQRKQADEALRESEERFRSLFENAPLGYQSLDRDGNFIELNQTWCKLLGYSKEEVLGRNFADFIHPDFREHFRENFPKFKSMGYILGVEFEMIKKDGTEIIVAFNGRIGHHDDGSFKQTHCVLSDVTDRKQAEEALLSEKQLSDDYINSLPGLFYVFDEQRFVRWNRQWEKVTGYNAQELAARYGPDFFEGEDRILIEERMGQVFREGASDAEAELVTKDGRRIPYYFTGLRKVFGGKDHLVGLGIDVTDRKRAQIEREELIAKLEAQNAELERFTYTVSHDLKSPLITIKGYVGMLRQDLPQADSGPVAEDLTRISDAADRMSRLLRDLLELSRIGRLANLPVEVSLEELAAEARDLVHGQTAEAGLEVEIGPGLPTVQGDRIRLVEVFQNLIDNAVKYMGDQSRPKIEIGARRDGNQTVCYVKDNGIGIESRYHEKIFGLFDQLDQSVDGTGIGLALVRRIIEIHGGRIWVESEGPGRGSTFCFTLAAKQQAPESGRAETS